MIQSAVWNDSLTADEWDDLDEMLDLSTRSASSDKRKEPLVDQLRVLLERMKFYSRNRSCGRKPLVVDQVGRKQVFVRLSTWRGIC